MIHFPKRDKISWSGSVKDAYFLSLAGRIAERLLDKAQVTTPHRFWMRPFNAHEAAKRAWDIAEAFVAEAEKRGHIKSLEELERLKEENDEEDKKKHPEEIRRRIGDEERKDA